MMTKMPNLTLGKIPPPLLAASAGLTCYALFVNRGLGLSAIGYSVARQSECLPVRSPLRLPADPRRKAREIDRNQVNLIITSDEVMSNEKYEPLKEYINRTFKTATHFGDVLILER